MRRKTRHLVYARLSLSVLLLLRLLFMTSITEVEDAMSSKLTIMS